MQLLQQRDRLRCPGAFVGDGIEANQRSTPSVRWATSTVTWPLATNARRSGGDELQARVHPRALLGGGERSFTERRAVERRRRASRFAALHGKWKAFDCKPLIIDETHLGANLSA